MNYWKFLYSYTDIFYIYIESLSKLHIHNSKFFICVGAVHRIKRLGEISLREYSEQMKIAIRNATQRVYMAKIVRSKTKDLAAGDKEDQLLNLYNAAV